ELNEMGPTTWQLADLTSPARFDETVDTFHSAVQQLRASGAVVAWANVPTAAAGSGPVMGRRLRLLNRAISVVVQQELGVVRFDATYASVDTIERAYHAARAELGLDASSLATPRPVRIMVTGDSTSLGLAAALAAYGVDHSNIVVDWAGQIGCPIVPVVHIRKIGADVNIGDEADCRRVDDLWPQHIAQFKPHLVFVVTRYMEAADPAATPDGPWEHIGERDFDAYLSAQYDADVRVAASTGARVAWATAPREDGPDWSTSHELHQRLARLNELYGALAARHPKLTMIPLAAFVDRSDGV